MSKIDPRRIYDEDTWDEYAEQEYEHTTRGHRMHRIREQQEKLHEQHKRDIYNKRHRDAEDA